ncbi:MAG: alkaline phosphatase D family protein [Bacteroidota bacterium]
MSSHKPSPPIAGLLARWVGMGLCLLIAIPGTFAQSGLLLNSEQADPTARLIFVEGGAVLHLLGTDGRYLASWSLAPGMEEALPISQGVVCGRWQKGGTLGLFSPNGAKLGQSDDPQAGMMIDRRGMPQSLSQWEEAGITSVVKLNASLDETWRWELRDARKDWNKQAALPADFRLHGLRLIPQGATFSNRRIRASHLWVHGTEGHIAVLHPRSGKLQWSTQWVGAKQVLPMKNGKLAAWVQVEGEQWQLQVKGLDASAPEWKSETFPKSAGSPSLVELPNGNLLASAPGSATVHEYGTEGKIVWSYALPEGQSVQVMGALTQQEFATFLPTGAPVPEFDNKEWREIRRRKPNQAQYKRLTRETLAQVEAGYLDDAQRFIDSFLIEYPEDAECYFGQFQLYARLGLWEQALQAAQQATKLGLQPGRFAAPLGNWGQAILAYEPFDQWLRSQEVGPVIHGPMLGQVQADQAKVWLRLRPGAKASVHVKDEKGKIVCHSTEQQAAPLAAGVTHFQLTGLSPQTDYTYEVWAEGQQVGEAHRFQTPPAAGQAGKIRLAFAGGAGYTPRYERMWDTMAVHHPLAFFSMGDNVYIDHPLRPLNQQYCYYRRQSRPEYRRFVGGSAIYAIWDDHDFTYNDERGGPDPNQPAWKRDVLSIFQENWLNPTYGGGEESPGIWFSTKFGEVEVFFLDCRYYRDDPKKEASSMLGAVQKAWLKEELQASTATFKLIASSVPWAIGTKPGSLDTWDGHAEEREEMFSFIEAQQIEGVVLISADRHRSDAWRIERPEGYPLYDLMSSRLTNVHTHKIMPGSLFGYNQTPSFGLLDIDTDREDPRLTYRIISIENEEIHRLSIFRSQLTFSE